MGGRGGGGRGRGRGGGGGVSGGPVMPTVEYLGRRGPRVYRQLLLAREIPYQPTNQPLHQPFASHTRQLQGKLRGLRALLLGLRPLLCVIITRAGHTRQLSRQCDSVLRSNKVLPVALPLHMKSKLHFDSKGCNHFSYFSLSKKP